MTTTEILMLIFGSVGSGIVAALAVYGIMRRMEKWKREAEPISPIPNSVGRLCTSNRVGLIRGVMWGFIVLLGLMLALLILFFVKKDIVYLLGGVLCSSSALLVAVIWVLLRRKYGDSIRYTDTAFTVVSLRAEPRRQTHPWNHLRGITAVDGTHIRLDFKNGTAITLAYLTDTDDLLRTARANIYE